MILPSGLIALRRCYGFEAPKAASWMGVASSTPAEQGRGLTCTARR